MSDASNLIQEYKKLPSSGPRELTPTMIHSIEEADRPTKRGKKPETQKEVRVTKPTKGQTPKKRNDSDSEYVSPIIKPSTHTDSKSESSDEEASARGATPPHSPTPEVHVRSKAPSPTPVSIPVSIPPIFPITTSQPSTTIPISAPIFTEATSTTTTGVRTNVSDTGARSSATEPPFTIEPPVTTEPPVSNEPPVTTKPLSPTQSTETNTVLGGEDLEFDSTYFSPYRVQSDDDEDAPVTKSHLKAVTEKLNQLLSSSSANAYFEAALKVMFSSVVKEHDASLSVAAKAIEASTSQCQKASLAAASQKNSQIVNASVDNLQRSLQAERSNLEAARQAIEAANATLHANVNDRLTQLEVELAVENHIMDELDKHTSQLKMQNLRLRTATNELNDFKCEREVIRSSVGDVHSILFHLLDAHDPILTISIRRHLPDKLRPALDILSRIEGVSVTDVQPKEGGDKAKSQPPPEPKSTAKPKVNEASDSKRDKKKKKIGEDDTNDEDDVFEENPSKPFQKTKLSDKELEEKFKKETVELEKNRKEKEILEKKKSIFLEWTIYSLQRSTIDEPSTHWLEPVMSFGLENSKDVLFDMSFGLENSKDVLSCRSAIVLDLEFTEDYNCQGTEALYSREVH
ncbi:unnamed protein product [Lactuca saligna]|uniref:Uncharacterized protein n=1 Tax=Lactuca saligna TaxID=75948 RepID=A0AA35ZDX9_LACSI|nr:unnamed protein product [Lactuca saligna]